MKKILKILLLVVSKKLNGYILNLL